MSIEIAQKYGLGVTYKGDDGGLYFKDEAGNVTNLTQPDQLVKVSSNDTTAGYLEGKLVAGSNITLTTNYDGGNETLTIAAAGGVTGFTASQNDTSPNNTVNASRLLVDATSTNADFVAQPKGTGALLAQLPDGMSTGGNKRGANANDFQTERYVAGDVASGAYSSVLGGIANKATAFRAVVVGGASSTASANDSIAGGNACIASGSAAVAMGQNNQATASNATAFGVGCQATSSQTTAIGNYNTASGFRSIALGSYALANREGMFAWAADPYSVQGDLQTQKHILRRETTNSTQTELSGGAGAPSNFNRISIASDATYTFSGLVTARRTDADNESGCWKIEGGIDNNAGTTAFVGTPIVTALGDDSAGVWDVTVDADDLNDALVIKVTGENGKTIRWGATVTLMKVAG